LRLDLGGPFWFPDVEPVLHAIRERWDLETVVLRSLDAGEDRDTQRHWVTYLLQPRSDAMPRHGRWVPVRDLVLSDPPADRCSDVLAVAFRGLGEPPLPTRRPWSERGWFEGAETWVDAALHAAGLAWSRPSVQLRTWGLSTVLRFGTPTGDFYFKAAAHSSVGFGARTGHRSFLFANEAALLAGLAGRFSDDVPRPVATDPGRVWMLLPDAGPALWESDDLDAWEATIRAHARHQRDWVGQETELFRIGCLDRRLGRLAASLDDLASDDTALAFLDPPDRDRLSSGLPAIRALIDEAASLGIPDTLVHGDLHAGNVGLRGGRSVFFDWTDACVSQPFLDLVTFLDESEVLDAAPGARERLRAAYLEEWSGVATRDALVRSAELAESVGMLHQAVSYQHMLPALEEPTRSAMGWGVTYWVPRLLDRLV
jgi:Phosphotransferase enzyme family